MWLNHWNKEIIGEGGLDMDLTQAQNRILISEISEENTQFNNIGGSIVINGLVDIEKLHEAVVFVLTKHKIFHVSIVPIDHEYQMIYNGDKYVDVPIVKVESDEDFTEYRKKQFDKLFVLDGDSSLVKSSIVLCPNSTNVLLIGHHIISDGWTFNILAKEIIQYYEGKMEPLEDTLVQYLEYAEKERNYLESERRKRDEKFFLNEYNKAELDYLKRESDSIELARRDKVALDEDVVRKIKEICKNKNISLSTFFLGVVSHVVRYQFSLKNICIGIGIHNRNSKKEMNIPGMFVSTLPFFCDTENYENITVEEYFRSTLKNVMSSYQHQKYPYNLLISNLKKNQKMSGELFSVMYSYLNFSESMTIDGNPVIYEDYLNGMQSEPICFLVNEWGGKDKIQISINYQIDIFTDFEIEQLKSSIDNFCKVIVGLDDWNTEKISSVCLCNDYEINLFNQLKTYKKDIDDISIYHRFKSVAELFEENEAIRWGEETVTYKQLLNKVRVFAKYLNDECGIKANDYVKLVMKNSVETIVAMLAILKLGATYIPLSIDKQTRMRFENDIQEISVALTITNLNDLEDENVININDLNLDGEYLDVENDEVLLGNAAYCMFTSGTTGKAKGILVSQKAILNLILNNNFAPVNNDDCILQLSDYGFDGSVFGIYGALLNGACLVIIGEQEKKDPQYIIEAIEKENISIFFITTALFNILVLCYKEKLKSVRKILFGGEKETYSVVKDALNYLGAGKLVHVYGPTENTVFSTYYPIDKLDDTGCIPIGYPIQGTGVMILDDNYMKVPRGVVGQLYVCGNNLSLKYVGHDEFEAPFLKINGERWYATGDYAYFNEGGAIVFKERKDCMVKIRGFRVDLAEIQNIILNNLNLIQNMYIEYFENELILYYTTKEEILDIQEKLCEFLPSYMVPNVVFRVENIPLKVNGKVDANCLRELFYNYKENMTSQEQDSQTEKLFYKDIELGTQVIDVVKKVLKNNTIQLDSNYYACGGDSIKANFIVFELRNKGIQSSINDLLLSKNLYEFCEKIYKMIDDNMESAGFENRMPAQMQSWIISNANGRPYDQFAQAVCVRFNCLADELNNAIVSFFEAHDELKYALDDEGWKLNTWGKNYSRYDVNIHEDSLEKELLKELNLKQGILFSYAIQEISKDSCRLYMLGHHFVTDAVSWYIIMHELSLLINKKECYKFNGMGIFDWCSKMNQIVNTRWYETEKKQWNDVIIAIEDKKYKFSDFIQNTKMVYDVIDFSFEIDETSDFSQEKLLASVLKSISVVKGGCAVPYLVFLEQNGRNTELCGSMDIESSIGWFTARFPLLFDVDTLELNQIYENVRKGIEGVKEGHGYNMVIQNIENFNEPNNFINFNFLGDLDDFETEDDYMIENTYMGGVADRKYIEGASIEIESWIKNGMVHVQCMYENTLFSENDMKMISDYCKKFIRENELQAVEKEDLNDNDEFAYLFSEGEDE